jgi:hypothetical protein
MTFVLVTLLLKVLLFIDFKLARVTVIEFREGLIFGAIDLGASC